LVPSRKDAELLTTNRAALHDQPIEIALNARGRTLAADDAVGLAHELFANSSVRVLPVVEDGRYLGAVDRELLAAAGADVPVGLLARPFLPTALGSTSAVEALALLDRSGDTRLVILAEDGETYRGIVCLRSDRLRLCIESECHVAD
jgi:CBS domain-containing protein